MQRLVVAAFVLVTSLNAPVAAQQDAQKALQSEADKGIKTQNSGASGFVGEQEKSGTAAHVPGHTDTSNAATAPSAQNSGAGIAGAPGNKNGPPAGATTGSSSQNLSVQQQDTSGVKGLPGSKSGPPAKK